MTIGEPASVVAAIAALLAVLCARATVGEAREARKEASNAHRELVALEQTATMDARAAATDEMADRQRALDTQVRLERIDHAIRITEIIFDIVDLARSEHQQFGDQAPVTTAGFHTVPALLTRLDAAINALLTLGGPHLPNAAALASASGEVPSRVLSLATSAQME